MQNIFGARLQFLPICEQQNRIEIALHGAFGTEAPPAIVERNAQSSPITSAPVSRIEGRSVALSVPK